MDESRTNFFESLKEAFEFQVDPVRILVAGQVYDVKKVDFPFLLPNHLNSNDTIISMTLQDGRELTALFSAVQGFITGRDWE